MARLNASKFFICARYQCSLYGIQKGAIVTHRDKEAKSTGKQIRSSANAGGNASKSHCHRFQQCV